MELTGKIIAALPVRSGVSQRTGSEWQLASYVLETQGERFARKMVFEGFGSDRIQQMNIQVGETRRVSFDIDSVCCSVWPGSGSVFGSCAFSSSFRASS